MIPAAVADGILLHRRVILMMSTMMLKEIMLATIKVTTPMELKLLISIQMIGIWFLPIRHGVGCGTLTFLAIMGRLEDGQAPLVSFN